ncbi:hypothetical protein E2562_010858 [Oryza meyeriana var. granulata]|uniref:Uncharacterized protein n=1 Tax=Oryza meyeriana var. granulata TaxID=110450 RepID=A0A6G1BKC2_9ORYZ|nr:hypothetical protein E2562_010858 [Oryza meyeriana var. granulata]
MNAESAIVAYAALDGFKCVAKEAELVVQRLRLGDRIYVHLSEHNLSARIRRDALGLMDGSGTGPASSLVTDPMVHSALLVLNGTSLVRFGLILEFVGRLPIPVSLAALDEDQLIQMAFYYIEVSEYVLDGILLY